MQWRNVRLILAREVRDQLRDRRTLFMIAVLPLLLYPLIGITFLQIAQFLKEYPSRVYFVGVDELPDSPPFISDGKIVPELYSSTFKGGLIELTIAKNGFFDGLDPSIAARRLLEQADVDAVVHFPPQFKKSLDQFRASVVSPSVASDPNQPLGVVDVPRPTIFFNTARDKSRVAHDRISAVLIRWRERIVDQTLIEHKVSSHVTSPFDVDDNDVAESSGQRAAVWSKILPFVMLIWALTGAFYPAIDLCAGEKERGTLETLLSSPAMRGEIVLGKLVTIMIFSVATSLLNLLSMAFTATFIIEKIRGIGPTPDDLLLGPPPLFSLVWLVLAMLPISALFSALSLALATMARSTKEGQYYLMPLLLITMPLLVLPMLPAVDLDLGTSLIPVTGVMLLLRRLMEGDYRDVFLYALPVSMVTLGCCYLAIRWAIDQFNNESVLFSESERLDLGLWLTHLVRDRGDTPSVAEAIMCGVLLLLIRFFAGFLLPFPETWDSFATMTLVTLVAFIAAPALLMTTVLTRRPHETLLLSRPPARSVTAALLLAICIHPAAMGMTELIQYLYPVRAGSFATFHQLLEQAPGTWQLILFLALTPALCEEIAFRGFILSGLRHMGSKWKAIIISSLFFGFAHGVLQQSIMATMVGIVIGYVAVQTRSLLPCVAFHFVHNSLVILSAELFEGFVEKYPEYQWLVLRVGEGHMYNWPVVLVSATLSFLLLAWFRALPYQPSPEERLQDALDHQSAHAAAQ